MGRKRGEFMTHRCTTKCALCVEEKDLTSTTKFDLPHLKLTFGWCVFRHDEPLPRGEYEVKISGDGRIGGTVCYRSKIMTKAKKGKRFSGGGM